jgi:hypothetical protein
MHYEALNPQVSLSTAMVMIPLGADGEPRPDLLREKPRTIANCEDYRKSNWDMPYPASFYLAILT